MYNIKIYTHCKVQMNSLLFPFIVVASSLFSALNEKLDVVAITNVLPHYSFSPDATIAPLV